MRKKEIQLTAKAIFDARDSNAYKDHRHYIMAAFKHYHKVDIESAKFGELVFDYHKDGSVVVTAHTGMYRHST